MEEPKPPAPMVRFFCDTSERGAVPELGEAYLEGFLTLGISVRIMSGAGTVSFGEPGRWMKYRELFMTQLTAPYINVVCLGRATIDVRIPVAPRIDPQMGLPRVRPEVEVDHAPAIGRVYTIGLKNILLTAEDPDEHRYVTAALRYESIVVPTSELARAWRNVGGRPLMVPPSSLAIMRQFRDMLHAA